MAAPVSLKQPFQAHWPRHLNPTRQSTLIKVAKVFWDAISIVIFPIGLTRLLFCYLRNLSYRIAVPGQIEIDTEIHSTWDLAFAISRFVFNPEIFKANLSDQGQALIEKNKGEGVDIRTPDGGRIRGAFIPGQYKEKVLLVAGGNVEQWETHRWIDKLKHLGTSFLCINSRGVGTSKGIRSAQGYALDYYSAYEYLIHEKGIDPENILLVGFSMGAANGTRGAAIIQQKYPAKQISAINICSFSSLRKVVYEILHPELPKISRIVSCGMRMIGVEINVKDAWRSLKGKKCVFFNEADNVIPFKASLAKAADIGSLAVQMYSSMPSHNRKFSPEETRTLENQIRDILGLPGDFSASLMNMMGGSLPVHVVSEVG